MWWAGSRSGKVHDVYVGTRAFAVCAGGGEVVLAQAVAGVEEALAALGQWLAQAEAKLSLRLWLSGGLCRPFIVPLVPGLKNASELARVLQAMAPQHTGLPGECQVWKDNDGEAPVAVAVQRVVLDSLQETVNAASQAHRHRIASIRPWWADALRAALQQEPAVPAVAVQDCDSLTVLTGRGGRFDIATTLTPVIDREAARSSLARLLLTTDVGEGQERVVRLVPLSEAALSSGLPSGERRDVALHALAEFSR